MILDLFAFHGDDSEGRAGLMLESITKYRRKVFKPSSKIF